MTQYILYLYCIRHVVTDASVTQSHRYQRYMNVTLQKTKKYSVPLLLAFMFSEGWRGREIYHYDIWTQMMKE